MSVPGRSLVPSEPSAATLLYKKFFLHVTIERCSGKWADLSPVVEIRRKRDDPKPFFVVVTAQFFRSEEEAYVCGVRLGKDWIDTHPFGL